MIAVDTNLLVYAHREDSQWHSAASDLLRELAEAPAPWGIPWPCLHEFLAIVTHPRIYAPPTPVASALTQVAAWLESPTVVVLSEGTGYWDVLASVLRASKVTGSRVHDARVAVLCQHHRVKELWTADRDFSRFSGHHDPQPAHSVGEGGPGSPELRSDSEPVRETARDPQATATAQVSTCRLTVRPHPSESRLAPRPMSGENGGV